MLRDKQLVKIEPGLHADMGGLYLRVSPKGLKSWVLRDRKDGKDTLRTIGHYPGMSLADARKVSQHVDTTVDIVYALKLYMSKLEVRRLDLKENLLTPLLDFKVTSTRRELVAWLQKKAETAPVYANRMLTSWKGFYDFAEQQGWIEQNPLSGVRTKFVGGSEKDRRKTRTLSWEEIEELINNPPIKNPEMLWVALILGQRMSECMWIVKNKKLTGIPTKTHPVNSQHWVPQTPLVRWVLNRYTDVPKRMSVSQALWRKGLDWTPHDLRRTFTSRLADLGVPPHVTEKMVDHKMVGMMAVYNHAEYRAERIAAQRLWDKKLLSLRKKVPRT